MARSIIIEDILPTRWRLRLRDGAGKTREVDFKSGTPLRLDMHDKVAAIDTTAKKSHRPSKDDPHPAAKTHSSRARDKAESSKDEPEKAPRAEKEQTEPKPAPEAAPRPRRRKPEPGTGPGDLAWEENDDDGVPGLRASFERGAFKILHAGGDMFALFYEWNSGKYQTLACGPLEALKESAAQWQGDNKLKPPRSNLGAEAAQVACAKPDEPPAPTPPPPTAEAVDPNKDKAIMEGFEATLQKVMASRGGKGGA